MSEFVNQYLKESVEIINTLDQDQIEKVAQELGKVRNAGGRLFVCGMGGSAGTASHSANDFMKICGIETHAPADNVSFLTAVANDEGLENIFSAYLQGSNLNNKDAVLILSVGGGNQEKNISVSLIKAIDYAKSIGSILLGIVGKDGGYTAQNANVCVIIPPMFPDRITPHTEGLCSVVLHLLVSHPALKIDVTKWESVK